MKLSELNLPERYRNDLSRLHVWMELESSDVFTLSDYSNVNHIQSVLEKQNIGNARRCDYIRSICSLMRYLGENHDSYCKLLREYKNRCDSVDKPSIDVNTSEVIKIASGDIVCDYGVRLLCMILLDEIGMSMKDVHDYMLDKSTSSINTELNIWTVNGCEYKVSNDLLLLLKNKPNEYNISYRDLSNKFKLSVGYTYSCIRRKIYVKPKLVPSVKVKNTISYSDVRINESLSKNVVKIHLDNLDRLWVKLYSNVPLNYNQYDTIECYNRLVSLEDISRNTRINYVTAICILLEEIGGRRYNDYKVYQQKLELEEYCANLKRTVEWFPNLYKRIQTVYDSVDNKSLRVLCLVILCNVSESNGEFKVRIEETGILRPSDLINTKFIDDGEHSYLNLEKKEWLIRSEQTKNKVTRKLVVSDVFVKGIYSIYGDKLPSYMIVAKNDKQYSGSMSEVIKRHIGCTFDEIRASYFSWRERTVTDRKDLLELCRRQGHKYSTAMMNYLRKIEV